MMSKFAIIAGLALLTQAFLIPAEISSSDSKLIDALPIEVAIKAKTQILNLECTGCPVPSTDIFGNKGWTSDVASHLSLFFSIQRSDDGDYLSLNNDHQIFPAVAPIMHPPTAVQVAKDDMAWQVGLGYEQHVRRSIKDNDGLELIQITIQVVQVGGWMVGGLQLVEIQLLQATDGSLLIFRVGTAETKNPLINPTEKGEKCKTIICMFRATITEKVAKFKKMGGCGSKTKKFPEGQGHHGARPHGGPNRHHHKKHGFARIFHVIKRVAFHMILPVFVGISVGLGACFIGRFVGNMIVFLWRTLYRRGQKGTYSRVQQEQTDVKVSVAEDSPPAYEDDVDEKAAN